MRILQFVAENFKRIRIVEITPKKRVTQITGKNGQGKTSVLDALWALLAGKRGIPDKPVRRGADRSRLRATLGDDEGKPLLIVTRTITQDRTTTLTVEAAPGATCPDGTPQAVLDTLIGQMSFDPIAFIHAGAKEQVELMRSMVKIEIDIDAENAAIEKEYDERRELKKKAEQLRHQEATYTYSINLPKDKIDEAEIGGRIERANAYNRSDEIVGAVQRRIDLGNAAQSAEHAVKDNQAAIAKFSDQVNDLEIQLENARKALEAAQNIHPKLMVDEAAAKQAFDNAPTGQPMDLAPLFRELEIAQLTNREIDRRTRWEEIDKERAETERQAEAKTRSIEDREERKRTAIAGAKMPIEGLSFDEKNVFFNSIPLEQLGEAEQIRLGVGLAMASNPKLRAVPIARGESLDEDALAMIEKMAEENNFQIFMAKVDSSGKVGIVLSDGRVESVNE